MERSCPGWFVNIGKFNVGGKIRCGRPQLYEDADLEAPL